MVSEATERYKPMAAAYYLYVENADASMQQALAHGAVLEMEVDDMPYSDRQGGVKDQHGNIWWISQRTIHEPYTPRGNARDLILLATAASTPEWHSYDRSYSSRTNCGSYVRSSLRTMK